MRAAAAFHTTCFPTTSNSQSSYFASVTSDEEIYQTMAMLMIDNVLQGFNAVLIACGQTGSGKTFTMLLMTLKQLVEHDSVHKLELSVVEAFKHHVAKIERPVRATEPDARVGQKEGQHEPRDAQGNHQGSHQHRFGLHAEPVCARRLAFRVETWRSWSRCTRTT